jgi:hypothetical protein
LKFPPKFLFSGRKNQKNCQHVEKSRHVEKSHHFVFFSKIFFNKFNLHISARCVQKIKTLGLQTQLPMTHAHDQEIISRHVAT